MMPVRFFGGDWDGAVLEIEEPLPQWWRMFPKRDDWEEFLRSDLLTYTLKRRVCPVMVKGYVWEYHYDS